MAQAKPDPFDAWLHRLSPAAVAATSPSPPVLKAAPEDDVAGDYRAWQQAVSPAAAAWMESHVPPPEPEPEPVDPSAVRYCCAESENGEFLVVRLFKTPQALARHIGKLEGQDFCLACFQGVFLRLSVGPRRMLQLPDGRLLTIPPGGDGDPAFLEADSVEFEWQEDGFVGPAYLAQGSTVEKDVAESGAGHAPPSHYDPADDDDDEEDEDD